jgi:phosphate transport system permease protein
VLRVQRRRFLGVSHSVWARQFFASMASIAILVLVLIMVFLLRDGAGFLSTYRQSLEHYRHSGMEWCDLIERPTREMARQTGSRLRRAAAVEPRPDLLEAVRTTEAAAARLFETLAPLRKEALKSHDTVGPPRILDAREPVHKELEVFAAHWRGLAARLPAKLDNAQAQELIDEVREGLPAQVERLSMVREEMAAWDASRPVSTFRAALAFAFGPRWVTNSLWQDFYGVLPLLTGSLIISAIALLLAAPLSVAAAVHVSQFAGPRERELLKPVIEFIQAIPSIVLGFLGIAFVGDFIKEASHWPLLAWLPGFPVEERLNMVTAGVLLAFMAVPTMFSLAEDALNNVPRSYAEASEALGATHLQTVFRVIVPAAAHGMLAALLLGLGRVIGETMVVLLVAGNRIALPDFGDGAAVLFQPTHTLTGIIAQELGEVSRGSPHWQALFMVGILLFFISLTVNAAARWFSRNLGQHRG